MFMVHWSESGGFTNFSVKLAHETHKSGKYTGLNSCRTRLVWSLPSDFLRKYISEFVPWRCSVDKQSASLMTVQSSLILLKCCHRKRMTHSWIKFYMTAFLNQGQVGSLFALSLILSLGCLVVYCVALQGSSMLLTPGWPSFDFERCSLELR